MPARLAGKTALTKNEELYTHAYTHLEETDDDPPREHLNKRRSKRIKVGAVRRSGYTAVADVIVIQPANPFCPSLRSRSFISR